MPSVSDDGDKQEMRHVTYKREQDEEEDRLDKIASKGKAVAEMQIQTDRIEDAKSQSEEYVATPSITHEKRDGVAQVDDSLEYEIRDDELVRLTKVRSPSEVSEDLEYKAPDSANRSDRAS